MNAEEMDKLAEEVYDWCLSRQSSNLNKDGSPGNPRNIGGPFKERIDNVKAFYRNIALWHLSKLKE